MERTPSPATAEFLSKLTEDQVWRLKFCDVDGHAITGEYVVVNDDVGGAEFGRPDASFAVCREHLEAFSPGPFALMTHNALYGVGHACVYVDSPTSDIGLPECRLCHDELDEGPGVARVRLADGTVREYPATPEGGMQMLRDTFEQGR